MSHAILRTRTVHEGWADLLLATVRLPDGNEISREIESHGDAVAVLPFDPERRVALLVEQFRAPPFHAAGVETTLECPAGILDEADPDAGVRREAAEETGVVLREVDRVGRAWTMPGISTERLHLYLAAYRTADRSGAGGGVADEHENITVREVPLADLAAMADDGRLDDLKTLMLLQTLRLRRPDLFGSVD